MTSPAQPDNRREQQAREVLGDKPQGSDLPDTEPGLTGGPATDAVPRANVASTDPLNPRQRSLVSPMPGEADDGGEALLSGQPHELGGERPDKTR